MILDDAYHTLEALSLSNGLRAVHPFSPSARYNMKSEVGLNGSTKEYSQNGHLTENEQLPEHTASTPMPSNGILNGTVNTSECSPNFSSVPGSLAQTPKTNGAASLESSRMLDKYQLLVYSARDEAALKRVIQQYGKYYDENVQYSADRLQQLAYTLAARRSVMTWRSFTVGNAELSSEALGLLKSDCVRASSETQISFVFTGQGAQYAKMGLELIHYPVFSSAMSRANKVFQSLGADWSLFGK